MKFNQSACAVNCADVVDRLFFQATVIHGLKGVFPLSRHAEDPFLICYSAGFFSFPVTGILNTYRILRGVFSFLAIQDIHSSLLIRNR